MARVFVRNGTEGPRHDPYSYTEITFVKTDGTAVRCKISGLGYGRLQVNGNGEISGTDTEIGALFEELTGMSFGRAECVPDIVEQRRINRLPKAEQLCYWQCKEADQQMLSYAY